MICAMCGKEIYGDPIYIHKEIPICSLRCEVEFAQFSPDEVHEILEVVRTARIFLSITRQPS